MCKVGGGEPGLCPEKIVLGSFRAWGLHNSAILHLRYGSSLERSRFGVLEEALTASPPDAFGPRRTGDGSSLARSQALLGLLRGRRVYHQEDVNG